MTSIPGTRLLHFVREGFVEVRENAGRTLLQTVGVILGVASVVATLGSSARPIPWAPCVTRPPSSPAAGGGQEDAIRLHVHHWLREKVRFTVNRGSGYGSGSRFTVNRGSGYAWEARFTVTSPSGNPRKSRFTVNRPFGYE